MKFSHPMQIRFRVTWGSTGALVCPSMASAQRLIRTLRRKGKTNIRLWPW